MWQAENEADMAQAVSALKAGQLVAFPTETVYGLGADGFNAEACRAIYAAKGRPSDNPLILHIADVAQLQAIAAELTEPARVAADAFWPGPLTLVLKKTDAVPDVVSGGLPTVAVRMPAHPVALDLIRQTGRPLAAPSANRSGKPSPTTAWHVWHDLGAHIAGVIDGGPCDVGLESTIVDMTVTPPAILRPGGISREALESCLGPVTEATTLDAEAAPKAPGMKYRHYAPDAPVYLMDDATKMTDLTAQMQSREDDALIGFLLSDETIGLLPPPPAFVRLYNLGSKAHPETAAHRLFAGLRHLDAEHVAGIYTESWPEDGIGMALMNRLRKLSKPYSREELK